MGIESVAPGFCTAIQPLKTPYIINFLNSNSSEIPNDNPPLNASPAATESITYISSGISIKYDSLPLYPNAP